MNRPGDPPSSAFSVSVTTRLEYERWPLREDPRRWPRLILLLAVVLVVGTILVISLPLLAAIGLGLALVATLLPYFLPRRYEVDGSGIAIWQGFYGFRRPWAEIESYQRLEAGYLLHFRPIGVTKSVCSNLLAANSKSFLVPLPVESEKMVLLEILLTRHIP